MSISPLNLVIGNRVRFYYRGETYQGTVVPKAKAHASQHHLHCIKLEKGERQYGSFNKYSMLDCVQLSIPEQGIFM